MFYANQDTLVTLMYKHGQA